jgi:hypothetical protein
MHAATTGKAPKDVEQRGPPPSGARYFAHQLVHELLSRWVWGYDRLLS